MRLSVPLLCGDDDYDMLTFHHILKDILRCEDKSPKINSEEQPVTTLNQPDSSDFRTLSFLFKLVLVKNPCNKFSTELSDHLFVFVEPFKFYFIEKAQDSDGFF